MSNEEGETRQELDKNKPKSTDPSNKIMSSPRGVIRAAFIIKSKNELKNREQAKQEKELAEQAQKEKELNKKAIDLYQKIIEAPHTDKSAKSLALEITEISAQFFQQMKVDDLPKMNNYQQNMLGFFKMPSTTFRDNYPATVFIKHLEQSIENNSKVLEGEGKGFVQSVPKNEAFAGLHFWHKVLMELQNNKDNFSYSLVVNYLANRNMSLATTEINDEKASAEYYKKYPEDKLIFANAYNAQKQLFENIKNQEDMIKLCFNQNLSIPSPMILSKLLNQYQTSNLANKQDVLAYQMLALQSSYFAFRVNQLDENIKKYQSENNYNALKPLLLEMQEMQQKALETIDERIKKCNELILQSDHLTLPTRYKEMSDLTELKSKLVQQQKFNITNMKLWNTNNKEALNSKENSNFPGNDKLNVLLQGNMKEYVSLNERKNDISSNITTLSILEKYTAKVEELRKLTYNNKTITEGELENSYNLFRQEIAGFKKSNFDIETQSPKSLFQHALEQAADDLFKLMDKNLNHGKIQILSQPGVMQEQINKLINDYEKHMNNLTNEISMPEAIKGRQDSMDRFAYLKSVMANPNFTVRGEQRIQLDNQIKDFEAKISPKVETTAKQEIISAPPEPIPDAPQMRLRSSRHS